MPNEELEGQEGQNADEKDFEARVEAAVKQRVDEAVAGLKRNRDDILEEKKKLEARFKKIEGIDPDEYAGLKAEKEDREKRKAEEEGNWKKLEEQLVSRHRKVVDELQGEITNLNGSLQREMIDARATEAITKHRGSVKLLLPSVRDAVRIERTEDGKYRAVVVDEHGDPRLAPDAKTASEYMTIEQYVLSLRDTDDYARAFEGTGASGSGATGAGGRAARTPGQIDRDDDAALSANIEAIASGKMKVV